MLALIFAGVHIGIALALVGFTGTAIIVGIKPAAWEVTASIFYTITNFKLVTVPLFILMGLLAAGGGVAERLYDSAELWVGKFRAGQG